MHVPQGSFQQHYAHTCIVYKSPDPGIVEECPGPGTGTPWYTTVGGPDVVTKPIVEPGSMPEEEDCTGSLV